MDLVIIPLYGLLSCAIGFWIRGAWENRGPKRTLTDVDLEAVTTAVWDRAYLDPATGQPATTARLLVDVRQALT